MGSGGMIVMDETSCMVDVARYFMEFCMTESCGKCVPCRVGTYQMQAAARTGSRTASDREGHRACLKILCDMVKNTSLCGLGQSAPNPVLSTMRYFAEEYKAHVDDDKCPAGVCGMPGERRRCSMNRAADVKTLKIDGRDVSAAQDETILEVARGQRHFHSHPLCIWKDCRRSAPAACAWWK